VRNAGRTRAERAGCGLQPWAVPAGRPARTASSVGAVPRSPRRFRYAAWSDGPDPLAPPFDIRAAIDELGERVLAGDSLRDAIRDLLRRGPTGQDRNGRERGGLDDLARRVRKRREQLRKSGRFGGTLDQVRELLDRALEAERAELMADDSDDARLAEAELAAVPDDTARAVTALAERQWRSPQAAQAYEQIRQLLQRDVLDARFRGMAQALADPDPAAMAAVKDMLSDLNALLETHARGQDSPEQFAEFMAKHGEFFPDDPADVDELLDSLARRQQAARRMFASMTPEQRQQLGELMDGAMQDMDLAAQLAALDDAVNALRPGSGRARGEQMRGSGSMGTGQSLDVLEEMGDLDALAEQLAQDHPGATLDDVDVETVERQFGARTAAEVQRLRDLERELQRQGFLTRGRGDELALTPKALRRLGQTALKAAFDQVRTGRRGTHDTRSAGAAGDPTGSHRQWVFGDEQPLDVVRTVSNAVLRSASDRTPPPADPVTGRRPGRRTVRLEPEDFAVTETEQRSSAAVALCVDLSYSMVAEDRWGPMKQTALAVAHLVATRFPQDSLQIIGFNRVATPMTTAELAAVDPEYLQGTNLQHALIHAGRHLRRHPQAEPVVLVVTDGEPTAHLEADGEAFFDWPPRPETIRATVEEVDALTRAGATINLFMLGEDPGLQRFVEAIARRNGGRVFSPDPARLGAFVVADYLRARTGRRAAA